jgi:hypothetical protein
VAGFKRFKDQRQALLDEVITGVLPNLPTSRCARRFVIGDNTDAAILVVSALLLHFMQASKTLIFLHDRTIFFDLYSACLAHRSEDHS